MPCHLIEIVIDKAWFHDTNSITVFTNRLLLSLFWRGVRTAHVALMHDFWDRSAPFDTIQKKQVWAGRIPKKQFGSICDSSSDCSSIRVLLREIWWLGSKKDPLPCSHITHITWRVPRGRSHIELGEMDGKETAGSGVTVVSPSAVADKSRGQAQIINQKILYRQHIVQWSDFIL